MQFKRAFGKPVVKRARTQAKFTICHTIPAYKGYKKGLMNAINSEFCLVIDSSYRRSLPSAAFMVLIPFYPKTAVPEFESFTSPDNFYN